MNKETFSDLVKAMSVKQKLVAFGIIALLTIGAFGAMGGFSDKNDSGLISSVGKAVGLKKSNPTTTKALPMPNGTPQLSKEYIYAGSRMLATEDYGIAPTNPTPTPLPPGGGGTPTPTNTPPPTPTPGPDPNTGCQYGFSSLGGVINSDPTTSVFAGKVYVFAKGTDGAIYYQSSTGGAFSGWNGLGGVLTSNPASMATATNLYVEATGTDNNRYYQTTTNGVNFSAWTGGSVTTQTNPTAVFNGQTYTFIKGTGSSPHLCVQVTAGGSTPTPTPTPDPVTGCPSGFNSLGGVINSDPTTSVFSNKVYVFAKGTDGAIYYQFSSGSSFSGWNGLGGILTSNPASSSDGSTLYVEATGTDNNRYYQATSDGNNFSGWIGGSVTTSTNPSAVFNGQTYTFVKGTGSSPHLCVKIQ